MRTEKHWRALGGMIMVDTGKKRRSGKPHTVLMIQEFVVMSEADAKLVTKKYPSLTFVEKTGRDTPRDPKKTR